jgi:hypothetical protein
VFAGRASSARQRAARRQIRRGGLLFSS